MDFLNHFFYILNKNYAFSKKADRFIYDGNTVTYMSIELAAYMGFSEIYLLGVDHNYPILRDNSGKVTVDKTVAAHFYETADDNYGDDSKHFKSAAIELVTKMYETAEKYSRDFGSFRIYNATRGGKLEVFERVEFDSLF